MNLRYERKKPQNVECIHGNIIWSPEERQTYYETPQNSHCIFRKEFFVEGDIEKADVKIFADSRYLLYLNGKKLGRGPCRSDPRWQYYDTYRIEEYVEKGRNVFAAEVLYYGYGTGHSISRIPALWVECNIDFKNGNRMIVSTDRSWKTFLPKTFNRSAPRVNGCKGPIEIWDMREAMDFALIEFDDLKWECAKERDITLSPFWNIYPKPIENLEEKYISYDSVIARGIGDAEPINEGCVIHKCIKNEISKIEAPAFGVISENVYKPVEKSKFNYCILDFKKVLAGYINLNITGSDGDIVDIVYSESLSNGKPVFDNISYRPVARFVLKKGINNLEAKFNYEAFQYVYLIFRNHDGDIVLNNGGIMTRNYPLNNISTFKTEDSNLQRIWDISTHTLELCMQDGFLDSPSREQQQWMGDGRFQAIMNYYYSGDCKIHEKLLLQIAQSQDFEGMTCSRYPDANHNFPPIPSFCLQWISSFGDYYMFTKKTELISDLWNSIISGMRWFSGYENALGLLENVRYWQYYDMSKNANGEMANYSMESMNAFINLMYAEAMKTVIDLSKVLGDFETEEFFSNKFEKLKNSIISLFWNDNVGAYSTYKNNVVISEAVNALALIVLHNKEDENALKVIANVFDVETRMSNIYQASPYFMIPVYRALNKMDRNDIALSETLKRYSPMIESNATSTWEHWKLVEGSFMHSACHAWAASPIVLIAENFLKINCDSKKNDTVIHQLGEFSARIVTPSGIYEMDSEKRGNKYALFNI